MDTPAVSASPAPEPSGGTPGEPSGAAAGEATGTALDEREGAAAEGPVRGAGRAAAARAAVARASVARAGRRVAGKVSDGDWARGMLARVEQPAAPAVSPWRLSAGTLIAGHPAVPSAAAWLLRKLGRFGEVMVGPEETGFDGKEVAWERVLEVRTRPTGMVPDTAVSKELGRLRELLPPVPGRAWVLDKAAVALMALALAAHDHRARGPRSSGQRNGGPQASPPDRDGQGREGQDEEGRQVACEIVYRNRLGRTRELPAGLFATAILGACPAASESIIATARARGVAVRPAPPGTGPTRADQADRLRAASAQFAAKVRALAPGQPGTPESPSTPGTPGSTAGLGIAAGPSITADPGTAEPGGTGPGIPGARDAPDDRVSG